MAFLQFNLQVKQLQKERNTREHGSCCQLLHKALMNALQQSHEAINTQPGQNMSGIHVAVFLLKRNANLYNVRVRLGGRRAISAIGRLLSALESKPVMYCEHQSFQVLSADLARTPLGSVTTWADLLAPSCQPDLRLRFLTPTIFTGTIERREKIEQFPWLAHLTFIPGGKVGLPITRASPMSRTCPRSDLLLAWLVSPALEHILESG